MRIRTFSILLLFALTLGSPVESTFAKPKKRKTKSKPSSTTITMVEPKKTSISQSAIKIETIPPLTLFPDPNQLVKTMVSPPKICEITTYPRYFTFLGGGGNFTNDNMLSVFGITSTVADTPNEPAKFSNKISGSDFGQTHGLDFYTKMVMAPGGTDPQTILLITGVSTQAYTKNTFNIKYADGRAVVEQEAREISKIYITGKSVLTPDESSSILLRGGIEAGIQNPGKSIPLLGLWQQKAMHSILPTAFVPVNINPEKLDIKGFASLLTGIGFQIPLGSQNPTRGDPFGYASVEGGLKVVSTNPADNSFNYVLAEVAIPVGGDFRITGANLVRVYREHTRGDFEVGIEGTTPQSIGSIPIGIHYRIPYGKLTHPLIQFDENSAKVEIRIGVPIPNNLLKLD